MISGAGAAGAYQGTVVSGGAGAGSGGAYPPAWVLSSMGMSSSSTGGFPPMYHPHHGVPVPVMHGLHPSMLTPALLASGGASYNHPYVGYALPYPYIPLSSNGVHGLDPSFLAAAGSMTAERREQLRIEKNNIISRLRGSTASSIPTVPVSSPPARCDSAGSKESCAVPTQAAISPSQPPSLAAADPPSVAPPAEEEEGEEEEKEAEEVVVPLPLPLPLPPPPPIMQAAATDAVPVPSTPSTTVNTGGTQSALSALRAAINSAARRPKDLSSSSGQPMDVPSSQPSGTSSNSSSAMAHGSRTVENAKIDATTSVIAASLSSGAAAAGEMHVSSISVVVKKPRAKRPGKRIEQYDLATGLMIAHYDSQGEAAQAMNVSDSYFSQCLSGRIKEPSFGLFGWRASKKEETEKKKKTEKTDRPHPPALSQEVLFQWFKQRSSSLRSKFLEELRSENPDNSIIRLLPDALNVIDVTTDPTTLSATFVEDLPELHRGLTGLKPKHRGKKETKNGEGEGAAEAGSGMGAISNMQYSSSSNQAPGNLAPKTKSSRRNGKGKPVEQYDLATGATIAQFDSGIAAALATGIHQSGISSCVRGKSNYISAGGFGWRVAGTSTVATSSAQSMDRLPSYVRTNHTSSSAAAAGASVSPNHKPSNFAATTSFFHPPLEMGAQGLQQSAGGFEWGQPGMGIGAGAASSSSSAVPQHIGMSSSSGQQKQGREKVHSRSSSAIDDIPNSAVDVSSSSAAAAAVAVAVQPSTLPSPPSSPSSLATSAHHSHSTLPPVPAPAIARAIDHSAIHNELPPNRMDVLAEIKALLLARKKQLTLSEIEDKASRLEQAVFSGRTDMHHIRENYFGPRTL